MPIFGRFCPHVKSRLFFAHIKMELKKMGRDSFVMCCMVFFSEWLYIFVVKYILHFMTQLVLLHITMTLSVSFRRLHLKGFVQTI